MTIVYISGEEINESDLFDRLRDNECVIMTASKVSRFAVFHTETVTTMNTRNIIYV